MQVLAHRGASLQETENTLEAFARARALGADGVELDVQQCASGEVVVFHDTDLARLAGRPERVVDLPLAGLRRVSLAGGGAIPTLAEVYEVVGPRLTVNVELKLDHARPTGLEAAVCEVVRRAGAEGRTVFSCFHPVPLWRLWRLAPEVERALLFGTEQALLLRHGLHALGVPARRVHPEHLVLDRATVRAWHRLGRTVHAWTVDDPSRIRALAQMGVDGVITDCPDVARDALMGLAGAGPGDA
jgi:glycerophosphoryl diester phosphodiesterase